MLVTHRRYIPAYSIPGQREQYPLCLYTILSINEVVGDCAAYEAIGPQNADEHLIERMKSGGNKIRPERARELFCEIEEMGLRYRL